jgi:soluble cytochrome b562
MKLSRFLATAALALAFTIPAFADETPLEVSMNKLNKSLKQIDRAVKAGTVGKELSAKVDDAKAAAKEGLKLEPAKTADVPAADKAKFLADYKTSMEETIKALDELKVAVDAGKTEEVGKILAKLNTQKKDGHKKFQKEE